MEKVDKAYYLLGYEWPITLFFFICFGAAIISGSLLLYSAIKNKRL